MTNQQQRKLNTYLREIVFINDNKADFPATSVGGKTAKTLEEIIVQIRALAGEQSSNSTMRQTSVKTDKIEELIQIMQMMNRAARAMADEIGGIENLFRMPRRQGIETIISTARAFHKDSEAYEAEFKDYELPDTFRQNMMTLISEIDDADSAKNTALTQRAGATGGLSDLFRDAGKLSNKLNAIVLNKYRNNAQKLASWAVASHVEAAPKNAENEEDTPETEK